MSTLRSLTPRPVRKLAGEVLRAGSRALRSPAQLRDRLVDTGAPSAPDGSLARLVRPLRVELAVQEREALAGVCERFLEHRFNLLGSGWIRLGPGTACPGLEGHRYPARTGADAGDALARDELPPRYRRRAERLWSMVGQGYLPLDWQLDIRSGYRWSARAWYRQIRYGHLPGVDVKVPWEVGRGQHLPMLALAHAQAAAGVSGFRPAEVYAAEFRNQVLDFLAHNPPRFGVQWICAMEVAIRAANWLIACDLFRAHGFAFDAAFERALADGVYQHALHLATNLESSGGFRGNHYLADVVGLLFCAAYLPRNPCTDGWLVFARDELIAETEAQFLADGGSFEASTHYHCLSAEMVTHATALLMAVPPERLLAQRPKLAGAPVRGRSSPAEAVPASHLDALGRIRAFLGGIVKPGGRMVQIGDNDGGRFLRLHPDYLPRTAAAARARYASLAAPGPDDLADHEVFWDDPHLKPSAVQAALDALLGEGGEGNAAGALVRAYAGERTDVRPHAVARRAVGDDAAREAMRARVEGLPGSSRRLVRLPIPAGAGDGVSTLAYPDFGLYIWRSERLFLSVRCGGVGQHGRGGHAHNDALAIELNVDGRDLIADPGSYLYTALPARRDEYRSVRAHASPRLSGEPGDLTRGLFVLPEKANATCVAFDRGGFAGEHSGYGVTVYRMVELEADAVVVLDGAEGAPWPADSGDWGTASVAFSPSYGVLLRSSAGMEEA